MCVRARQLDRINLSNDIGQYWPSFRFEMIYFSSLLLYFVVIPVIYVLNTYVSIEYNHVLTYSTAFFRHFMYLYVFNENFGRGNNQLKVASE